MGSLDGLVEAVVQGATWGLSDKIGITGKGGIVHDGDDDPENQAVIINDNGVYFVESEIRVGWSDVNKIALLEEGLFRIELRGGLTVLTGWIHWDEDWLEANDKECTGECDHTPILDDDIDLDVYDDELATAIVDVFWAADIADKVRSSEHMVLNESLLLRYYFIAYAVLFDFGTEVNTIEDEDKIAKKFKSFISVIDGEDLEEMCDKIFEIIKSQLARIDGDDEDEYGLIAELFAQSRVYGKGVVSQAKQYDNLRNAKAYGKKFENNEAVDVLTSNWDEKGYKPLGDLAWANLRQTIVCTDERAALTTWHDGLQIPNVMVMDAQDIIDYNDAVEDDMKLTFEIDHPQNGVTYIQHPMRKNVYIDLDSFHGNLLREKFEELKKLLDALGAVSITCKVTRNDSSDKKQRKKRTAGAEVDITAVGEGSGRYEHSDASTRMLAIFEEMETEIVNEKPTAKPHLPDGLIFYPFETAWQNLASSVLNGRRKEENTTLTYRSDYAVTGQRLTSIEGKLKSLVPGYQFGIGGNFAQEFEQELKQLKSTVWHYHVCFDNPKSEAGAGGKRAGKRAEKQIVQSQAIKSDKMSCVSTQKNVQEMGGYSKSAERETVLKRVRRLAQSDNVRKTGLFSDEQRAAIESFAAKKGICDDVDDLIEEALG